MKYLYNDGKLDLFSVSRIALHLYEPNTRITTYYDNDGDGLCDERKDIVIPNVGKQNNQIVINMANILENNGADVNAFIERTTYNDLIEKPRMNDILNPKTEIKHNWVF